MSLLRADFLQIRQVRIGFHAPYLIPILDRNPLRLPAQLLKPFLHLTPARFASTTMCAVWAVDSKAGHQVADPISEVHNPPCRNSGHSSGLLRPMWRELGSHRRRSPSAGKKYSLSLSEHADAVDVRIPSSHLAPASRLAWQSYRRSTLGTRYCRKVGFHLLGLRGWCTYGGKCCSAREK